MKRRIRIETSMETETRVFGNDIPALYVYMYMRTGDQKGGSVDLECGGIDRCGGGGGGGRSEQTDKYQTNSSRCDRFVIGNTSIGTPSSIAKTRTDRPV